jgi:hypothetical protein
MSDLLVPTQLCFPVVDHSALYLSFFLSSVEVIDSRVTFLHI